MTELRPADDDDIQAIVALERAAFGDDAWSVELVDAELLHGSAAVVDADGEVLGWVAVRGDEPADLTRVAVHPDARRRGLGRALVDGAVDLARLEGADRMLLEVAATNGPAIQLYRSAGFVEISRRRGYYGAGVDALVMELAPLGGHATLDA
ncbi:GNAT family N-acetyltransferase [Aeromicrobium terrae]|uniref:GNAT family N-acetyltransferase n=1 Tax=Aeromicrobium terrae TaxID=2498846 RepID=A0A5C8NF60_9ACTN|nr:GNAT family N-acetyltransferase [Aeromicrobium terrae]TXL57220.1 GNAT family N-acetyltransferase [Aeromicrobium terrae]